MHKQFDKPDKIIKNLFTSGFTLRDKEGRSTGRQVKFPGAQEKFAEYLLQQNWEEICGPHLAKNCCVHKIKGDSLTIRTASSLLANELFMMKELFIKKINACLEGKLIIKKLNFQAGSNIIQYSKENEAVLEETVVEATEYTKPCLKCGVIVQSDSNLCDVCAREENNLLMSKIAELLNVQPWMKYEECTKYFKCDRILFNRVKDSLKNTYFEKVRLNSADEKDCLMAVMFLTGKEPGEIDEKIYENGLAHLRRNQSVFTPGIRLHGKK